MLICKVQGKCISTIKNEGLKGHSLIIVQKINKTGNTTGELIVAADPLGCAVGETVLVTKGSSARFALKTQNSSVDAVIVGIVDNFDMN